MLNLETEGFSESLVTNCQSVGCNILDEFIFISNIVRTSYLVVLSLFMLEMGWPIEMKLGHFFHLTISIL
jgi:hypothetical protein